MSGDTQVSEIYNQLVSDDHGILSKFATVRFTYRIPGNLPVLSAPLIKIVRR